MSNACGIVIPEPEQPSDLEPLGRSGWLAIDLRSLALMRVALAVMLLVDLVMRAVDARMMYTDAGVLPRPDMIDGFGAATQYYALQLVRHARAAVGHHGGARARDGSAARRLPHAHHDHPVLAAADEPAPPQPAHLSRWRPHGAARAVLVHVPPARRPLVDRQRPQRRPPAPQRRLLRHPRPRSARPDLARLRRRRDPQAVLADVAGRRRRVLRAARRPARNRARRLAPPARAHPARAQLAHDPRRALRSPAALPAALHEPAPGSSPC